MKWSVFTIFGVLAVSCGLVLGGGLLPAALPVVPKGTAVEKAVDALREGRNSAAKTILEPLVEKGDPDALLLAGYLMESEEVLRQSIIDRIDYLYRKSAEQGQPEGRFRHWLIDLAVKRDRDATLMNFKAAATIDGSPANRILGEAWLRGFVDGTPNAQEAAGLWEKAGKGGDAPSFFLLGKLNEGKFGPVAPTDLGAAARYYMEAAKMGYGDAFEPLCSLLLLGPGPISNAEEGLKWADEALGRGVRQIHFVLGQYHEKVRKDNASAIAFYRKGIEYDNLDCMYGLGVNCLDRSDAEGKVEGMAWLAKAADAGDPQAAFRLGGLVVKEDPKKGYGYLLSAGNNGIPEAQYALGMLYLDGAMGTPDPKAAIPWFMEAMKSGDAQMQYQLAYLNENGIGCTVNYANAAVLYNMAANKGHGKAPGRIARMSDEGLGMKRNPVQAWAYAKLAIGRGDESLNPLLMKLDAELGEAEKANARKTLAELEKTNLPKAAASGNE